jgi:endoribonuclease LACTB2
VNIKEASAIILLKDDKVLLAQRNPNLTFLGGWHAFPGGKLDQPDCNVEVKNCEDIELKRFIVCAVRELFEEVGVLIVRNGDKLTKGQRASLHDDLVSGRSTFKEILDDWGLWIDASDFEYSGFWTTPNFSPLRFKTRFFIANCPNKQTPYEAISEMQKPEFVLPNEALNRWEKSEILISPPVLITLQQLAKTKDQSPKMVSRKLLEKSRICDGNIDYVELNSRVIVFPLKTPTLPPATHTNCFIVGRKKFVVIDAASADKDEQAKLHKLVDELIDNGGNCKEIIVSHLHNDHHGGEIALQTHLHEKHGKRVPISTHSITAESLKEIDFGRLIQDGDVYELEDANGKSFLLKSLHTPGHARGLLNFYDEEYGFLLSTDNIVGMGTVLIAPPEGNMQNYLQTLNRLNNLPNLRNLCGSHGSAIFDAKQKICEYINHRQQREHQILQIFTSGFTKSEEIAEKIYDGLDSKLIPLAIKTVDAHLEKLKAESRI